MVVTVLLDSWRKYVFVEIVNFGQIRSALGSSVEQRNDQYSARYTKTQYCQHPRQCLLRVCAVTHRSPKSNVLRSQNIVHFCAIYDGSKARSEQDWFGTSQPGIHTTPHTSVSNIWPQLLSRDRCKVERLNTLSLDLTLKSPSCISPETCARAMTGQVSSFVLDNSCSRNMW